MYDTWGKLVSIKDGNNNDVTNVTTSVGYKNPYRYRGYRYDTETGLYYCNSRYYNPEWGRFINADSLVGKPGELLSHNVFAYCKNNPVNMIDSSGHFAFLIPLVVWGASELATAAMVTAGAIATGVLAKEVGDRFLSKNNAPDKYTNPPNVGYPGNDPTTAPGDGFEWRGKPGSVPGDGQGRWYNPETGESYSPDLDHADPIGPHWDYKDENGDNWRIHPDGQVLPGDHTY